MKNNLTILCYHGVTKEKKSKCIENFSGKHMPLKTFKTQMDTLKKKCKIFSLREVYNKIRFKTPFPKNSVCVTFDDGFRNNFNVAAPILKKKEYLLSFLYVLKNIENQELFWVDKIEACVNKTKKKR